MTKLSASQVLNRYSVEEELPVFFGMQLDDVNQISPSGERPLDVAAGRGSIEEVQALLDGGAEINAIGSMGRTALHEAVAQNHGEVVRLLLRWGAFEDTEDDFNCTPLDIARRYKNTDIIDMLSTERKSHR